MNIKDFEMGAEFLCDGNRWRCTDIGTRVVVAICIEDHGDVSWFNGPPYAVAESVFDENDMEGCSLTEEREAS